MRANLGQHFLRSPSALRALATAVPVPNGACVVEVGPGKGALTSLLLQTGVSVLAVEKDAGLAAAVQATFSEAVSQERLRVVVGDIRDDDWRDMVSGPYAVIANIPYYLTGALLRRLLDTDHQPYAIAVMVQKDVAERVVARDGKESLLSLSVRLFGEPRILRTVPRTAFSPRPSVTSAILTVTGIHMPSRSVRDAFFSLVHRAFSGKRKQVGKKFADDALSWRMLRERGVRPVDRAEDISFATWRSVAEAVADS